MSSVLGVFQVFLCIVLIFLILMHSGTDAGLSGAFGVGSGAGPFGGGSLVERIWMSRRLPLLGLAKLEMPGTGYLMEVTGFGKGATARMILPEQIDRAIRLEPVPQGAR